MINFPTSLDSLTNPVASDQTTVVHHATQHADANDLLEAIQAKIGIDSSAVATSLDYLIKNAASLNPGHLHTISAITLSAETGNEVAYTLNYTVNKLTSGNDTGLLISMTDTASPGTSKTIDIQVGASSIFSIDQQGWVSSVKGFIGDDLRPSTDNKTLFVNNGRNYTVADNAVELMSGTFSNTSGASAALVIKPTYNQLSGTAANTDLLINRTQTAVGSGTQYLIDAQVGSASKFSVDNVGNILTVGSLGATGTRVVKGWFTDAEFTNVPTIGGNALGTIYASLGVANAFTVGGHTITVANTADVDGLTITQNDTTNNKAALKIVTPVDAASGYSFIIQHDNGAVNGAFIKTYHNSSSPAVNDCIGGWDLWGNSSTGVARQYCNINGIIVSPTNEAEEAKIVFALYSAGSLATRLNVSASSLYPGTNDGMSLGIANTNAFSDLFLASGGVINWNNGNATLTHSAGLLTSNVSLSIGTSNALTLGTIELGHASDTTISRSAAGVIQVEGVVIPSISSTNTLTNKRITQRVITTTDDATAVIDVDTTDVYELSAVANATEFSTTGTPTDGQKLIIRFKDAGVAKAITWNSVFVAIGVTAPTTTVAGKWHYVGATYNTAATKWHIIATGVQA